MFFSKVARILAIVAFVLGLLERALINPIRPSRHTMSALPSGADIAEPAPLGH
jgi:hypothetical protein